MKGETERIFRDLYNEHYGDVYRFVMQSVKKQEEVEDLVQDIFIQAYRNFEKFRGECGYKTWLFAIAHNQLNSMWRKFFRRKQIAEQYEQDLAAEAYAMDDEWEKRILTADLHASLAQLSDAYREVMVLRYIHDFSVADAAIIMNTKESRVRVLTHRAIIKLREIWERGGEKACKIESDYLKA
ncbi:hypothetical protein CBW65_02200 [Tumebacillus avium]|uniref:RNA polymerase subunit sigma n=1 Tax=Tumebacillus avium TaxID=1903704 RepID=A0A1Y0IHT7_9BACL|nr:sigma-70 family RNA polymerase sigma factor [Tumebacillus avium]ARU60007.1 hypothetical protein CBW65_02200 [Tumebacillus avium]